MAKQKYYTVWKGLTPGVYESWEECQKQIKGFDGAVYKSFKTREQAEIALNHEFSDYIGKENQLIDLSEEELERIGKPILNSMSVDAACSGNPGKMEYQGVYTANGQKIFHQGPFEEGTNNIGEFLALVHGLAHMKKEGLEIPIYSDSDIAIKWVKNKVFKTKLKRNAKNDMLFNLAERALKWLKTNNYSTEILKWNTKAWGEIPADFNRK